MTQSTRALLQCCIVTRHRISVGSDHNGLQMCFVTNKLFCVSGADDSVSTAALEREPKGHEGKAMLQTGNRYDHWRYVTTPHTSSENERHMLSHDVCRLSDASNREPMCNLWINQCSMVTRPVGTQRYLKGGDDSINRIEKHTPMRLQPTLYVLCLREM